MEQNKIDLKNLTPAQKKKFIAYGIFAIGIISICVFLFGGFNSDDDKQVKNIETPSAETDMYNEKISKINADSVQNNIGDIDNKATTNTTNLQSTISDIEREITDIKPIQDQQPAQTQQPTQTYQQPPQTYQQPITTYQQPPQTYQQPPQTYQQPVKPTQPKKQQQIRVYKASIGEQRNKYLTPQNNRVPVMVRETFSIKNIEIPQGTILIAYASFSKSLSLKISSIKKNNTIIPVDIDVLDSQGQPALEIIGGTGDDIQKDVEDEITNQSVGNRVIDGAVKIFKSKRTKKAKINSDFVLLKINENNYEN